MGGAVGDWLIRGDLYSAIEAQRAAGQDFFSAQSANLILVV